jgi:uncharacterized protein YceH (UPF0502 family)
MRSLTPIEARVLATLMEKARTVPDSYPLSLNALVLGCNQKSSRDPVMEVSDDDARTAVTALKAMSLIFEASSSRVPRYEHNFMRISRPSSTARQRLQRAASRAAGPADATRPANPGGAAHGR